MDAGQIAIAAAVTVGAFLIGGIPWGVVIARVTGGPDPRTIGSGRTGGANVLRALGPRAAIVSGMLDLLKGIVAVVIAIAVGGGLPLEILAAVAAIIGHSRSPFIGFKGGRGIAPGFGSLIVIHPIAALVTMPVFAIVLLATRYSSLASLTATVVAAVTIIVTTIAWNGSLLYIVYAIAAGGMIWLFHIDNVQRLLNGTERRIELRR
jgi:glycerol-3-phosphate acyltransferase PlsY